MKRKNRIRKSRSRTSKTRKAAVLMLAAFLLVSQTFSTSNAQGFISFDGESEEEMNLEKLTGAESDFDMESETEVKDDPNTDAVSPSDTGTRSDAGVESAVNAGSDIKTDSDNKADPDAESESDIKADTGAGSDADVREDMETDPDVRTNIETESEIKMDSGTEKDGGTEPDSSTAASEGQPLTDESEKSEALTEDYTESSTEISDVNSTVQSSQTELSGEKNDWTVTLLNTDRTPFAEDITISLRSLEEIAADDENPQEASEQYRDILKELAAEELLQWYIDRKADCAPEFLSESDLKQKLVQSVALKNPMELGLYYEDGSVFEADQVNLSIRFTDTVLANALSEQRSVLIPVLYDFTLVPSIPDAESCSVTVNAESEIEVSISNIPCPYMFTLAVFDQASFDSAAEETGEQENVRNSNSSTGEAEAGAESEIQSEIQSENRLSDDSESVSGSVSDLESDLSDAGTVPANEITVFSYDTVQAGIPCVNSAAYTKVTEGSRTYSQEYTFLRGTSRTDIEYWYDSSVVMMGYRENDGRKYLMPLSDDAKGRFGFRLTNVAYNREAQCTMDMLMTVTDFSDYSYNKNGEQVSGVYPFIGMTRKLSVFFQGNLPDFELTCELVKSGTTQKIAGNYRFMWLDIDDAQKYGFSLIDGTMDARYCLTTCDVNCGEETRFGHNYHVLYAPNDTTEYSDMYRSVMFEISNMSAFRIYVGLNGDITASTDTILERYQDALDGIYNRTYGSALGWDGIAYGPTELPAPLVKYVSNDGSSWSSSNTLPAVDSEYWYRLEFYVPQETSDYYYSGLAIEDSLPSGVDYAGEYYVTNAESGKTVSGFTVTEKQDTITIDAASLIKSSSFYGWTYCIQLKVRMDTSEISPKYSGSQAVYSVQNQALLRGKHKTDSSISESSSNQVTTIAANTLTGRIVIRKTDKSGRPLSGAVFEVYAKEDICREDICQKEPELLYGAGEKITSVTTGSDGTAILESCYSGAYTVKETVPPAGYALNTTTQTVTVTLPDSDGIIPDAAAEFQNEPTLVILKKISEKAPGDKTEVPVPDVEFRVWKKETDPEDGELYRTDRSGVIRLEGLMPATYLYQETASAEGYIKDNTVHEFTIDSTGLCESEHGHVISCVNQYTKIEISKVDKATGALLAGARLQLTDENGTVLDTWTSSESSHSVIRIPKGTYILSELEAPNGYKKSDPIRITVSDTAEIQQFSITNCRYVEILLTKAISAEEIVWDHGNPVFTFCVEGTDLDSEEHRYYETVEFKEISTADNGTVTATARFLVPAGTYRAYETNVIRYHLAAIESVHNGKVAGVGVNFDLSGNENGSATFVNRKRTDSNLTHTAFVRNSINAGSSS